VASFRLMVSFRVRLELDAYQYHNVANFVSRKCAHLCPLFGGGGSSLVERINKKNFQNQGQYLADASFVTYDRKTEAALL